MTARNLQKSETTLLDEDYQNVHDSFIRCQTEMENMHKELRKAEKAIKEKHERSVEVWNDALDRKEEEILERFRENDRILIHCKSALERMDIFIQTLSNQVKIMNAHIDDGTNLEIYLKS